MAVTGLYMARRVQGSILAYLQTYAEHVCKDALPIFENLSARANAVADAEYARLAAQPAAEGCDGGLSLVAETAENKGQVFYDTMVSLHQMSLNLFAVGLFHILEQYLAELCRDDAFEAPPPSDTKLCVVSRWFAKHFNLNLSTLSGWSKVDELRLLTNTVKHGDGPSARKLREKRPDLFQNPAVREILPEYPEVYTTMAIRSPLGGESIFVNPVIFDEFSKAASSFVGEIAAHFLAHDKDEYTVC